LEPGLYEAQDLSFFSPPVCRSQDIGVVIILRYRPGKKNPDSGSIHPSKNRANQTGILSHSERGALQSWALRGESALNPFWIFLGLRYRFTLGYFEFAALPRPAHAPRRKMS
jgi:hypothetical protein